MGDQISPLKTEYLNSRLKKCLEHLKPFDLEAAVKDNNAFESNKQEW